MNDHTKAMIKNAAVLSAHALRHYRLARPHEALLASQQAMATLAEALELLDHELEETHNTAS